MGNFAENLNWGNRFRPPPPCVVSLVTKNMKSQVKNREKVYFSSQILERPSISEYWNISGVPVLTENVIFTFFRTCWWHPEANNTRTQKWSSNVQYLGLEVYFFPKIVFFPNERYFQIWFPKRKQLHFSKESYLNYPKKTQFCMWH